MLCFSGVSGPFEGWGSGHNWGMGNCRGTLGYARSRRRRSIVGFNLPPFLKELLQDPIKRQTRIPVSSLVVVNRQRIPERFFKRMEENLVGKTVSSEQVVRELDPVMNWCKESGYVQSGIDVKHMPSRKDPRLILECHEPTLVGVRLIAVDKENVPDPAIKPRTKPSTIAHALGMTVGDIFRWNERGLDLLLTSGLLEYAKAELEILPKDYVEAIIYLRERKGGRCEPGIGMNSDGRVFGDVSIVDNNFRGLGQRLRLEWQRRVDSGKSSGGFEFDDPMVGSSLPMSYKFRLYRDSKSDRAINVMGREATAVLETHTERDRNGFLIDLSYKPTPFVSLSIGPIVEKILAPRDGSANAENQGLLRFSAKLDTKRPLAAPREGRFARMEYSVGSKLSDSVRPKLFFYRMFFSLAQYFKVGQHSFLGVRGKLGLGSRNVPSWEQTVLGGPKTLRGFRYGELGHATTYGAGRVELRIPLLRPTALSREQQSTEPKSLLDKMPSLTGILFSDFLADLGPTNRDHGSSIGIGVHLGGVLKIEYTYGSHGREPRIQFGLVEPEL